MNNLADIIPIRHYYSSRIRPTHILMMIKALLAKRQLQIETYPLLLKCDRNRHCGFQYACWLDGMMRSFMVVYIYIIITKNIRYLLWNRGVWCFFHDTYLTIEVQRIRCTNHLHDSPPLTDVNPHFTAPGCRYYFKINSRWPIVTSSTHGPVASYCDVTMAHFSHGYLWTHDVEVDAS